MPDIYATVTTTDNRLTDASTVTVDGVTAPVVTLTSDFGILAPKRVSETLAGMGWRTLEILPSDDPGSCQVRVERAW